MPTVLNTPFRDPLRPVSRQSEPALASLPVPEPALASLRARRDIPADLVDRPAGWLDPRLAPALLGGADWAAAGAGATLAAAAGFNLSPGAVTLAQAAPVLAVSLLLKALSPVRGAAPTLAALVAAFALVVLTGSLSATPGLATALTLLAPLAALWIVARALCARVLFGPSATAGAVREKVVVIGATEAARRFIRVNNQSRAVDIVAVFDDRGARAPKDVEGVTVFGDVQTLLAWPDLPEIDQVVVAVSPSAETRVKGLIERLRVAPNRVVLLLDLERFSPEPMRMDRVGGVAAAQVAGAARDGRFAATKRAQDLLIGVALAVVFSPLMALVALAVRLDSRGPILFSQARHGFNNRVITVWKFRTMRPQPDGAPLVQVSSGDPRVTRIGGFLRRTSLDELPQLWNVLRGEMSLVGPRPHAVNMRTGDTESSRIVAEYAHRCRVKPGLTGWAQINGSRGPLHGADEVRERVRLDLEYIARANLWFDLSILARTAPALLGDKLRIR